MGRFAHFAVLYETTDRGTADRLISNLDWSDHVNLKTELMGIPFELLHTSLPSAAEMVIIPNDDSGGTDSFMENRFHKRSGRQRSEFLREIGTDDHVDSETLDQHHLFLEWCNEGGTSIGVKDPERVGFECENDRLSPVLSGRCPGPFEDELVAQVDTIKITQGNHRVS